MNVDSARIWDSPVISAQSSSNPQLTHEPQNFLNQQHMSTDAVPRQTYHHQLYAAVAAVQAQGIPTEGPATHPDGPPRDYSFTQTPQQGPFSENNQSHSIQQHQPLSSTDPMPALDSQSSKPEIFFVNSSELYTRTKQESVPSSPSSDSTALGGTGTNHYPSSNGVPRLPPILQVEKQQVTTSATQLASASRRRNEAHFQCPVPGCGSTFTRRFNLRGHLRSHTEERPYVCEWPGCKKGFARQHDCKRHQALHTAKSQSNICQGCKKTFSRLDALNRHLRSEGGAECRASNQKFGDEGPREEQGVGAPLIMQ